MRGRTRTSKKVKKVNPSWRTRKPALIMLDYRGGDEAPVPSSPSRLRRGCGASTKGQEEVLGPSASCVRKALLARFVRQ